MAFFTDDFLKQRRKEFLKSIEKLQYQVNKVWYIYAI